MTDHDHVTATGCPRGLPGILEFPCTAIRLNNGNTLIIDAGDEIGAGSEVIEVNPTGQIVWNPTRDMRFAHSAVRMPNGNTLIADTTNDRVIEITPQGDIVWTTEGLTLSDGTRLEYPNNAIALPEGTFLITDRNNNRALIINRQGTISWQYADNIQHPHNAERLSNGNFIIADSDGNRIIEITPDGEEVWSYGDGSPDILNWPRHARRLDNGNTLITDSKNSRVIEITPEGQTVWTFQVDYFSKFYYAEKLPNDNVLIADQQGHRVIEVDPAGTIVWEFRNYIYPNPILPRLKNGSFKTRDKINWPEDWILMRRFSEGGGEVIWDEDAKPRPCPGLSYDRKGALCLQQTIRCTPNTTYHMAGQIRTENLEGHACFQMSFTDALGAAIHDAPDIPRGQTFSGTTPWTPDNFTAIAPPNATALEIRLFITGTGKAYMKGLLVHT